MADSTAVYRRGNQPELVRYNGFRQSQRAIFTTPPAAEIWQSPFFIATTLAATSLTFIVICGVTDVAGGKMTKPDSNSKLLTTAAGTVLATYLLLILLSVTVRPMVTTRYMYIFSLIWYAAGAAVLAKSSFLPRGFIIIALLGFAGTYGDFKAAFLTEAFTIWRMTSRPLFPKTSLSLRLTTTTCFANITCPNIRVWRLSAPTGKSCDARRS